MKADVSIKYYLKKYNESGKYERDYIFFTDSDEVIHHCLDETINSINNRIDDIIYYSDRSKLKILKFPETEEDKIQVIKDNIHHIVYLNRTVFYQIGCEYTLTFSLDSEMVLNVDEKDMKDYGDMHNGIPRKLVEINNLCYPWR